MAKRPAAAHRQGVDVRWAPDVRWLGRDRTSGSSRTSGNFLDFGSVADVTDVRWPPVVRSPGTRRTSGKRRSSGACSLQQLRFFRLLFHASLADGVGDPWRSHSSFSSVKLRQYLCMHTSGVSSSIPSSKGASTRKGDDSPLCM